MPNTPPNQSIPPVTRAEFRRSGPPPGAPAVPTVCDFASQLITYLHNRRAMFSALRELATDRWGSRYRDFWAARLKELGQLPDGQAPLLGGILKVMDWIGPVMSGVNEVLERQPKTWTGVLWHAGAAAGLDVAMGYAGRAGIGRLTMDVGGGARLAAVDSLVGVMFPGASPSQTIKSSLEAAPGIVGGIAQLAFTSNTEIARDFHQQSLDGEYGPVFRAASSLGDAAHGDFAGVTKFDDDVYNGKYGAALSLVSSSTRGFDGLAHFDELSRNGELGWFAGKCNETGQIVADVIAKPKILGNLIFGW